MRWLLTLPLIASAASPSLARSRPATGFAHPELVVSAAALRSLLADPTVRIVDARPASQYKDGHVAGAVSLPVTETLAAPEARKGHPARPAALAAIFAARGIRSDGRTVIYDNGKETTAARLFWTLEYAGARGVAVLDGGMRAWKAAGGPVNGEVPAVAAARFTAAPVEKRLATKAVTRAAMKAPRTVLFDVRTPAEHRGEDRRAAEGGHIPGAVNLEWTAVLEEDGRLKPAAAVAALYRSHGITADKRVITHCQSGYRSSVTYWTLRLLGYKDVANYAGSWEEWGNDPETPKAKVAE